MATTLSHDHTLPDAELFKTRYPVFTSVGDLLIGMIIDEAQDHVDSRWMAKDYQSAIMYLTAHMLTLEGEPERSDAIAAAAGTGATTGKLPGVISKVEVGDVKTWFDTSKGSTKASVGENALIGMTEDRMNFARTHYGQMFVRLRAKNHGGPRVLRAR